VSATGQIARPPRFELVVLVASLGGLEATSTVLSGLPEKFAIPLVLVQHGRRSQDLDALMRLLQRRTHLPVRVAGVGTSARMPGVVVIPFGCIATLDPALRFQLREGDGLHGGDALFTSAAAAVGSAVIGVVLTGMLRDGSQGVRAIKRHGGRVIVQDPTTARAAGMPSSAIATGCIDFVLPLHRIAPALVALTMAPGAAELLTVPTPPWAQLHG
jgi:two-component system chemotaxis response regulator CheB